MRIPQKWQYALRAVFELAKHGQAGPLKVAHIAAAQRIPPRFLEAILNQLKAVGIVDSRRGKAGGYLLVRSPGSLSVGEVMRCLDGAVDPVHCETVGTADSCPFYRDCVFLPMWNKAWEAMWRVYDRTTFQQLADEARRKDEQYVPFYSI